MPEQPPELAEAIRLYKEGRRSESRQALVALLTHRPAYLRAPVGLACTSDDLEEARAAAELAAKLDPHSADAARALAEVRDKAAVGTAAEPDASHLAAEILRRTGMTLAQARGTAWAGRGPRCPIGELLDRGEIDYRDLAWAVDGSFDTRCQTAARTILLHDLLGVEELRYHLDGQWTLYRNPEWPHRRRGHVDLVLVGPGGLWALEVKARRRKS